MRRIAITAVSILGATVAFAATAGPALAMNLTPGQKISSPTTLDACGYFVGTQTANKTALSGTGVYSENGTWTGVSNNYGNGPVASLGTVQGSYTETTTTNSAGDTSGTETFRSNAGQINQTFSYGPDVVGGFNVQVTATGSLSFLTSSTAPGGCYSGPFPRS